jgi:hypothetical protein
MCASANLRRLIQNRRPSSASCQEETSTRRGYMRRQCKLWIAMIPGLEIGAESAQGLQVELAGPFSLDRFDYQTSSLEQLIKCHDVRGYKVPSE